MTVVDFDTGDNWGANANYGSRTGFTAPVAGIYRFSWGLVTGTVSGYLQPFHYKNGSAFSYAGAGANNIAGGTWVAGTDMVELAAGDFVEPVLYWSNGGAAVTLLANANYTFFEGELVVRV